LAQDWGIGIEEAEATLKAWYNDRPEVLKWQENTKKNAQKNGYVRTILGR
jgi:DNA polymerase-1